MCLYMCVCVCVCVCVHGVCVFVLRLAHSVTVPRGAASEYRICVIIMAGLNARGLQSKLLITPLSE